MERCSMHQPSTCSVVRVSQAAKVGGRDSSRTCSEAPIGEKTEGIARAEMDPVATTQYQAESIKVGRCITTG